VLAVLAVTATALGSTTAASQVKARKTSLGMIIVDSKGHTLYLFAKDKSGKSSCYSACAANWPPYLTTGKPTAATGVKTAMLGTTKRTDGKLQVTYNHHPLYRFKFDTKAGSTKGENANAFGAHWFAVSPKGVKVPPPPTGPTGPGGPPPPPPPPYP
jgi:predicted lipoprotein with Yx(FWY)xxD motif